MRHYDPWIFEMLGEIEHREELQHLAKTRSSKCPRAASNQAREVTARVGGGECDSRRLSAGDSADDKRD